MSTILSWAIVSYKDRTVTTIIIKENQRIGTNGHEKDFTLLSHGECKEGYQYDWHIGQSLYPW